MKEVEAFCRQWDMLPEGALVLCAVSGGRDSMALLHLLCAMSGRGGFSVAAAHYNHQLRPAAGRDEAFVRAWCGERGIPFFCGRGDVAAFAKEEGRSLEEAARILRYRFLEETADRAGAARIATAHHREDNAETVLLHLLRGTGLHGLTGIAPVRGRIVRPLLEMSREAINGYVRENSIPYVEDETNADPAYTRNRLRLEVLPLLEDLSPGCASRIAGACGLLRVEDEHLRREAEALLPPVEQGAVTVPATVLLGQDEALRRRLVRTMARRLGTELTAAQTEAVLALGSGGYMDLPGGLCAVRKPHKLTLRYKKPALEPLKLSSGRQEWGPYGVRLWETTEEPPETADAVTLDAKRAAGPLTIAAWDGAGRLAVENGSRTIKRLFADRGVPVEKREEHPALYLEGRPVAVFGVAVDWEFRPRPGARRLVVTLERKEGGDDLLL